MVLVLDVESLPSNIVTSGHCDHFFAFYEALSSLHTHRHATWAEGARLEGHVALYIDSTLVYDDRAALMTSQRPSHPSRSQVTYVAVATWARAEEYDGRNKSRLISVVLPTPDQSSPTPVRIPTCTPPMLAQHIAFVHLFYLLPTVMTLCGPFIIFLHVWPADSALASSTPARVFASFVLLSLSPMGCIGPRHCIH
jgi:hypothetical protein